MIIDPRFKKFGLQTKTQFTDEEFQTLINQYPQISQLEQLYNEYKKLYQQKNTSIANIPNQIQNLNATISQQTSQSSYLNNMISQQSAGIQELEGMISPTETPPAWLTFTINQFKQEIQQYQTQLDNTSSTISSSSQQIQNLQQQLDDFNTKFNDIETQLTDLASSMGATIPSVE